MNAAIRAVVKVGAGRGVEVFGVDGGYDGLIEGRIRPLTQSVGGRLTPKRAVRRRMKMMETVEGALAR